MNKVAIKNFHEIKAGEIVSYGGQLEQFGWVYRVNYKDGTPISLQLAPLKHRDDKSDDTIQKIPNGALKAVGLNPRRRDYYVGTRTIEYTPTETEQFLCYPAIGKTDFGKQLFRQIDDIALNELRSQSAVVERSPTLKSKPSHVRDSQKSGKTKVMDITLDDAQTIGLIPHNSDISRPLQSAGIKRLKTAFDLTNTPENYPVLRQIYDMSPSPQMTFKQWTTAIRNAWTDFTNRYDTQDRAIANINIWFDKKESLKTYYTTMRTDISIDDANREDLGYFECQYTGSILNSIGVTTLRTAYQLATSKKSSGELSSALNNSARSMGINPSTIKEDIKNAWETFEENARTQPLDFPDDVKILHVAP